MQFEVGAELAKRYGLDADRCAGAQFGERPWHRARYVVRSPGPEEPAEIATVRIRSWHNLGNMVHQLLHALAFAERHDIPAVSGPVTPWFERRHRRGGPALVRHAVQAPGARRPLLLPAAARDPGALAAGAPPGGAANPVRGRSRPDRHAGRDGRPPEVRRRVRRRSAPRLLAAVPGLLHERRHPRGCPCRPAGLPGPGSPPARAAPGLVRGQRRAGPRAGVRRPAGRRRHAHRGDHPLHLARDAGAVVRLALAGGPIRLPPPGRAPGRWGSRRVPPGPATGRRSAPGARAARRTGRPRTGRRRARTAWRARLLLRTASCVASSVDPAGHSHSMVPGGLLVTSTATRLISRTSLVIRVEMVSITS